VVFQPCGGFVCAVTDDRLHVGCAPDAFKMFIGNIFKGSTERVEMHDFSTACGCQFVYVFVYVCLRGV
jgi:hypothetical protein